nr:hypothetical protein Iba_chr09bCG13760 [Ipomoea batatas]
MQFILELLRLELSGITKAFSQILCISWPQNFSSQRHREQQRHVMWH